MRFLDRIYLNVETREEGLPGLEPRLRFKLHPREQERDRHNRVRGTDEDGVHGGQGHRQAIPINPHDGVHPIIRGHREHRMHGAFPHTQPYRHLREDQKLKLPAAQSIWPQE
jgi:hypothetical protein